MTRPQEPWQTKAASWANDPFAFVLEALFDITEEQWHPWVPGTPQPAVSPVGPEVWQATVLRDVGRAITEGKRRFSVRSGHGSGKSTLQAWLILWAVLFRQPCKVPVTANSQDQLRDVVFAEIAGWWRRLPPFLKDMIDVTTERVVNKADPEGAFAVARTARPERPEALQGFHAPNLFFFVEEASGIDDIIFETAGGALSSEHAWLFLFGNPTRTSGYFFRSHHENRGQFRTYHVPCQHSSRVSPTYPEEVAREYGEQSNVYRVRVLGDFPTSEDDSVIPLGLLLAAYDREVLPSDHAMVWGLDVARFGDDTTALAKRRGNVLIEPVREWRKLDLMQTAGIIAREYSEAAERPAAINVDVIGLGAGVVDRLRELGLPVRGINVGESPALDPQRYMRLRDELWFKVRDWFESRAVTMPKDEALTAELVAPKYKLESSGKLKVESKDEMKRRGVKSPNKADALCLTFAGGDLSFSVQQQIRAISHYDPFRLEAWDDVGHQRIAGAEYSPY
jgi:phage terminase large subunit